MRPTGIVVIAFLSVACVVGARTADGRTRRATDPPSCEYVKDFFNDRNISLNLQNTKGGICGGSCCDSNAESSLRKQGQRDFATLLRHNSRSLQGLLNSTATVLQGHIIDVTKSSENGTLLLFNRIYQKMAYLAKKPITNLYADLRNYVQVNHSEDAFSASTVDLKTSVTLFFSEVFPLVHHHGNAAETDFTVEYKYCLKQHVNDVQPFGDKPRQIIQSLSKSLDATRLLLQAFDIGIEVLNATDSLISEDNGKGNDECHDALLKMNYCPSCLGLKGHPKPCSGYCLNVLRGCLTKYVAELDSPWNGYVEGIEHLVTAMKHHNNEAGVNADAVIKELEARISEAIMHAMAKKQEIDQKVKRACGSAKFSEKEDPSLLNASTISPSISKRPKVSSGKQIPPQQPDSTLTQFLVSIGKSKGFYSNLADNLCQDESFAEPKDQNCWNGERVGEYTQTVADVGVIAQRYNPEVKASSDLQNVDSRVANLADKLRHVHQMVMSSLGSVGLPESDNYMQDAGADGSGSGGGPDFTDDDDLNIRGSGSGDGPHNPDEHEPKSDNEIESYSPKNTPDSTNKPNSSSSVKSNLLAIILVATTFRLFLA